MLWKSTTMKSLTMGGLLTMLLTGCATVPRPVACPDLPDPPESVVDALDNARKSDKKASDWVVDLSQHYDALDICEGIIK